MLYRSLTTLFFVLLSAQVQATVISANNSVLEYATGKHADLQGLEWLSFNHTDGYSRTYVESNILTNVEDGGWRYASRLETETLINSLWGGVFDGYASNNYLGAKWFVDIFGVTFGGPLNFIGINDSATFFFGNIYECSDLSYVSCSGVVDYADNYQNDINAYNVISKTVETSYIANSRGVGSFMDTSGGDFGRLSRNNLVLNSASLSSYASLLTRDTVSVPEPSILALFSLGLLGFGFTRRQRMLTPTSKH